MLFYLMQLRLQTLRKFVKKIKHNLYIFLPIMFLMVPPANLIKKQT